MTFRVLDPNKNYVGLITNYSDYCITRKLSLDDRTISLTIPIDHALQNGITSEGYLETDEDQYVIREIRTSSEGQVSVVAPLNVEELEGKTWLTFKALELSIDEALLLAFSGLPWGVTVVDASFSDKKRSLYATETNAYEILKKALESYRAECKIDAKNKRIYIYSEIGEDKGVYFSNELNLKSLESESDTYEFYTELEAYGKDGLTFADINGGLNYVTNHEYSTKVKRYIWRDERYTIKENLLIDAVDKLRDLSKPRVSYTVNIIDLAKLSTQYSMLDYSIGDTVTIIDYVTRTRDKRRITEVTEYPDNPANNTCVIADAVLNYQDLIADIYDRVDNFNSVMNSDGTIRGSAVDALTAGQVDGLAEQVDDLVAGNETVAGLTSTVERINADYVSTQYLQANYINTETLRANYASIDYLRANYINADTIRASYLTADQLDARYASIQELHANYASIDTLEANYASIGMLEADRARITDLEAHVITTDYLEANYAQINMANVTTACITTAMIEDAAITTALIADGSIVDSKIVSLTANKITAGRLDAANIEVINLNASNITTGTLNGVYIARGTIGSDQLGANSVGRDQIADGSVGADQLGDDAISPDAIHDALSGGIDDLVTTSRYNEPITANSPINEGCIGVFNSSGKLIMLRSSTPFDTTQPIVYVGTAYTNAALTQTDNYVLYGKKFKLTNTVSTFSGTAGKSVFIVGTLDERMFTPDPSVFTTTVPTREDGKTYMLLGRMVTSTEATLYMTHTMYKYYNEAFRSFDEISIFGAIEAAEAHESANGKNKIFYSASQPSSEGRVVGDIWFETDQGYRMWSWTGSGWNLGRFGNNAIENIDAGKITSGFISAARIEAGSITASKISSRTITSDKIAANAITTDKLNANAVTADKIVSSAITADKIAAGAITSAKITSNAITAAKIDSGAVTSVKIAAGAITADKISVDDLYALQAKIGGFYIGSNSIYSVPKDNSTTLGQNAGLIFGLTTSNGNGYLTIRSLTSYNASSSSPYTWKNDLVIQGLSNNSEAEIRSSNLAARLDLVSNAGITNESLGSNYHMLGATHFNGPVDVYGSFRVDTSKGTKNIITPTDDYGYQSYTSYELPSPMLGDIGSGEIDETGMCFVEIDDIFQESVNLNRPYQVFLQKCGEGDLWVSDKSGAYFAVKGTPGLVFDWEIKGKQKYHVDRRFSEKIEDYEGAINIPLYEDDYNAYIETVSGLEMQYAEDSMTDEFNIDTYSLAKNLNEIQDYAIGLDDTAEIEDGIENYADDLYNDADIFQYYDEEMEEFAA